MGGKGKVFVIQGMLGNSAGPGATRPSEALAEYPDIEVVEDDTGNWQPPSA
jgi:ribose transport system substrate-binding protein